MNVIGVTGQAGAGKDSAADRLVASHGYIKISLADPLKRYAKEVYAFTDDQLWGPSSSRNAPDKRYLRTRHERHDWQEVEKPAKATKGRGGSASITTEWVCTQCSFSADEAGVECLVYLTPRFCLQLLGTEFGRTCYENTWIDLALRNTREVLEGDKCYTPQGGLYVDPSAPRPTGVAIADVRFWNELEGIQNAGGYLWRIKPQVPVETGEAWRKHASETQQGEIPDDRFDEVIINRKVAFETLYADVDAALARCLKKP